MKNSLTCLAWVKPGRPSFLHSPLQGTSLLGKAQGWKMQVLVTRRSQRSDLGSSCPQFIQKQHFTRSRACLLLRFSSSLCFQFAIIFSSPTTRVAGLRSKHLLAVAFGRKLCVGADCCGLYAEKEFLTSAAWYLVCVRGQACSNSDARRTQIHVQRTFPGYRYMPDTVLRALM